MLLSTEADITLKNIHAIVKLGYLLMLLMLLLSFIIQNIIFIYTVSDYWNR